MALARRAPDGCLTAVLRLALGLQTRDDPAPDWDRTIRLARRERCASLAWQRSGQIIREVAPASTVADWRRTVYRDLNRSERQLDALRQVIPALEAVDAAPVLLKGMALSFRLYGEPHIRPSSDIDLFVRRDRRSEAHETLLTLGWLHVAGGSPWEETFDWVAGKRHLPLEVHSQVLDDPVLAHLRLPAPTGPTVELGNVPVRTFDDRLLAGYLAAHLAKHDFVPLLWLIDFHAVWLGADDGERAGMIREARRHGLHRYLQWAIRKTDHLDRAAAGETAAWRQLGYEGEARLEGHSLLRVAALAATPGDAARVVAGRLHPPHLRADGEGFIRHAARRLRRRYAGPRPTKSGEAVAVPSSPPAGAGRILSIESPDLVDLVRDVVARGGSCWVGVSGKSMLPAIPSRAVVRLTGEESPIRSGDVVLARLPSGTCVLHRVMRADATHLVLQGDGNINPDPVIARSAVVAIADAIHVRGRTKPVPARSVVSPRRLWYRLRSAVWRWERALTAQSC